MKWLNSFGDLLYEVMSWLIFYPITLWRAIVSPLQMMEYANSELRDTEDEQFTDTLNPPLFLLLSLLVTQALDEAFTGGVNPLIKDQRGLAAFITDDTTLLALRLVFFSMFPLMMATRSLRAKGVKLTRGRLKSPFYAQCYATAPFALILGMGVSIGQSHMPAASVVGTALSIGALLFYLITQTRWFARHLRQHPYRAFFNSLRGMAEGTIAALILGLLFVH